MSTRDPWKVHGYFFSACLGVFGVAIGHFFAWILDIPLDEPINALSPGQQVVFILLLAVISALSYLLARMASLAFHNVIDFFRK